MTFDVEQAKPDLSVIELDDSELLLVHSELHAYWKEFEQYGRIVDDWDRDSLIQVHDKIRRELSSRDLPHPPLNDLDDKSPTFTKPVQFEALSPEQGYEQVGESYVDLEDWE